jgi:hypothetical protein
MKPLNLFYEEPDPDRWLPLDHYPRRIIRRLVRGKPKPGGQTRVFLNLCAGLDKLGISYRVNDYYYIQQHPEEVACIIGKPQVLDKIQWKNPILFGAAIFSHPCDDPNLFDRLPICKMLVPGAWMRQMCEPYYGDRVAAWPTGIATDEWTPASSKNKGIDFLLYDKVRWNHEHYERELISPIQSYLESQSFTVATIRYGSYKEEDFRSILDRCKAMIFLCEHETQGIAYQQALSCDVPILAWERGGFWQDPSYFPHKVEFAPVSSVPYWNDHCGIKFKDMSDFFSKLDEFIAEMNSNKFAPRDYILENLTLEKCAQDYVNILNNL